MVYRNRILPTGGEQGPPGPPGADGADGSVWHWVTGTPAGSLGKVGDWATRTDTGATWEKTGASTWTSRGSLRGPQGIQGIQGPQGATGPQGIQGIQGPTGATGPKGDQGDTGPAGAAATVSVGSTTTGAPGTDASVTQSGTPQARTFNFTIPRGATGAKGDAGEEGSRWFTGTSQPGPSANIGDFFLSTINGNYYEKTDPSTWTLRGNLEGPQGPAGGSGILGGGKGTTDSAQSIPNGSWTVVNRSGSPSWTHITPPGSPDQTTVFAGGQMHCRVNSAGWWVVGASLGYSAGGATGGRYLMVETWTGTDPGVGNTANNRIIYQQNNNPSSSAVTFNVSTVVYLAANTNVRLCAYQTSGSALSTNTAFPTELWLTRVL